MPLFGYAGCVGKVVLMGGSEDCCGDEKQVGRGEQRHEDEGHSRPLYRLQTSDGHNRHHSGKTHSDFKTKSRLGRVKRVVVIEGDMDFFGFRDEIANARRYASYLVI